MDKIYPNYGCHCELMPGQLPDQCVITIGKHNDCCIAIKLIAGKKSKLDCEFWLPVKK